MRQTFKLSPPEIEEAKIMIASSFKTVSAFAKSAGCARSTAVNYIHGRGVSEMNYLLLGATLNEASGKPHVKKPTVFEVEATRLDKMNRPIHRCLVKVSQHLSDPNLFRITGSERYVRFTDGRAPEFMGYIDAVVIRQVSFNRADEVDIVIHQFNL